MEEVLALVLIFGGGTLVLLAFSPLGRAIAARIQGRPGAGRGDELARQVGEAQAEVLEELEHVRRDMAELQERMDFAERLLAKQREAPKLPPEGGER